MTPNTSIRKTKSSQRSPGELGVTKITMTQSATRPPSTAYSLPHAGFCAGRRGVIFSPDKPKSDQDQVDELDAGERNHDPADPIDPEVAAEQ